jgi:hypothetical protein
MANAVFFVALFIVLLPIFAPIVYKYSKDADDFYKVLIEKMRGKH